MERNIHIIYNMQIPKILSDIYRQTRDRKYYFLVASFSILLNWAGNTFVYENSYNFIYFDTLGTFVAVITLGSVWGMLVALATALLFSVITSPHFIYLAVVNMAAALYWGLLSETGTLSILKNSRSASKSTLRTNLSSAFIFILFAGIGCGLLTAAFSSVIRGVVFDGFSFVQPYSLYFAQWFKQLFGVADAGWAGIFANYVADTFIEIPDKLLTSFFGMAICLTIFKFNIKHLTDTYQDKVQENDIAWYRIMLGKFNALEVALFFILGALYLFKVRSISFEMLMGFIESISVYSLRDYVFVEMILLPLFVIMAFAAVKFFMPKKKKTELREVEITAGTNFYLKNMNSDVKNFLIDAFLFVTVIIAVYLFILISITGITPIEYYEAVSSERAKPETLAWLLIMLIIFVLIDRRNNKTTEALTLNDELIKKQTADHISESFDAQRQKLQVLELNWSDNTVQFLRSARHDLVNQLEKSKTGMNDLLVEVYDSVVKPYSKSILESQKEMRAYIDEITSGKLSEYKLKDIDAKIESIADVLRQKIGAYIDIEYSGFKDPGESFCKMNKLFFVAFNNILDNSVYALQRKVLRADFKAYLLISLKEENEKEVMFRVMDNAGGLSKDKLSKIYKESVESSKGERLGEGTMIAKNFVKLLDGHITAQNIRSHGENGLETIIRLPYFKK